MNYKETNLVNIDYNKFNKAPCEERNGISKEEEEEEKNESGTISPEELSNALGDLNKCENIMFWPEFAEIIEYIHRYRQLYVAHDYFVLFENYGSFKTLNEIIGLNLIGESDLSNDERDAIKNHLLNLVLDCYISFTAQSPELIVKICKNGFIIKFRQSYAKYTIEQLEMALIVIENIYYKKITLFNNIQYAMVPITSQTIMEICNQCKESEMLFIQEHCIKVLANIASIAPNQDQCENIANFFISTFQNNENDIIRFNSLRGLSFLLENNSHKKININIKKEISKISLWCQSQEIDEYKYYGYILGERIIFYFSNEIEDSDNKDLLPEYINEIPFEYVLSSIQDQTETLCLAAIKFGVSLGMHNNSRILIQSGFVNSLLHAMDLSFEIKTAAMYLLCILYEEYNSLLDILLENGFDPTSITDSLDCEYMEPFLYTLILMARNPPLLEQMIENDIADSIAEINPNNESSEHLKQSLLELLSSND